MKRHAKLVGFGVAIYAIYFVTTVVSSLSYFDRFSTGIVAHPYSLNGRLYANAMTERAAEILRRFEVRLEVSAINGRSTCEAPPKRCGFVWAETLYRNELGDENQFELREINSGETHSVVLPVEPTHTLAALETIWRNLMLAFMALLYVVIGALVWRRRPQDPAATPLMLFCLASGFTLGGVFFSSDWARWCGHAARLFQPWMLGFLFLVAHSFSSKQQSSLTWRFRLLMGTCVLHGLLAFGAVAVWNLGLVDTRPLTAFLERALGVLALFGIGLALHATIQAARPPNPLALRRRARVFGWAIGLGFIYPTLWLLLREPILKSGQDELFFLGLPLSFAAFPALLAYAILRHRMFDLRIVLRQGLIYGLLSVLLTLAYLGVLVLSYQTIGSNHSDGAALIAVAFLVVLFGVVRARLERAIDGLVFRGRLVFRSAVEQTSSALAGAHSVPAVAGALKQPLLGALGLKRAYVALLLPERPLLSTYALNDVDAEPAARADDAEPSPLPSELQPDQLTPLKRALETGLPVTAYDSSALASEGAERTFWERYGLELIVPFGVSRTLGSPRGAILLGSKQNGRPFDPEDTRLVQTLGQQVALATENALAFERLQNSSHTLEQLVAGIVHEANTPLGALGSSLDTIERLIAKLEQQQEPKNERLFATASTLLKNADASHHRLNELIVALKEYVNLEETAQQRTDLIRCVSNATHWIEQQHGQPERKRITAHLPTQPATINAYPAKLTRIVQNLLENALQAGAGRVELRLSQSAVTDVWRLTVADRGRGMSPETQHQLFDFGFSEKSKQGRMSLRLGLPYAKRVIDELGGRIRVHSELGRGTTVSIELSGQPNPSDATGLAGAA